MKEIKLTKGKVALVDDEDYESLSVNKWAGMFDGNNWYAYRTSGSRGKRFRIMMHRFILGLTNQKEVVDHKDGDGLNNQKVNLRVCHNNQNSMNRRVKFNAKCGYKGVLYKEKHKSYQASINVKGKFIFGGHFKTPIEAAKRYNELAVIHHGEFAKLNTL
jgi:hypothetical protein